MQSACRAGADKNCTSGAAQAMLICEMPEMLRSRVYVSKLNKEPWLWKKHDVRQHGQVAFAQHHIDTNSERPHVSREGVAPACRVQLSMSR